MTSQLLADDPRSLFETARRMYATPYGEVERWQLEAVRQRFDSLVDGVPALKRMAERATVRSVSDLEQTAKLLYPGSIYKSYRLRWLESREFPPLTHWLQQLTTHDLSGVKLEGCATLDEWFTRIEAGTSLRICHSSSTSGKLSFVPRSVEEWVRRSRTMEFASEPAGREDGDDRVELSGLPIISPFYRSGHSAFLMSLDWNIKVFGHEEQVVTAYPGALSSDLMLLAGQLRNANPDEESVPALLRDRSEEFQAAVRGVSSDALAHFVSESHRRFGNQQVFLIGVWPNLVDASVAAAALGLEGCFAPDTIVHTGGGSKGRDLPPDASKGVFRWLGVSDVRDTYGMSEVMGINQRCLHDKYHFNPWTIVHVLDPTTLNPAPRSGTHTGRLAAVDLMASSYWGGYVSSDLVTLTWSPSCACGRQGPYIGTDIKRVQDEGSDEKVSCAATPAAFEHALEFLRKADR
jgi:Acyl-protein synthetase, LuxE